MCVLSYVTFVKSFLLFYCSAIKIIGKGNVPSIIIIEPYLGEVLNDGKQNSPLCFGDIAPCSSADTVDFVDSYTLISKELNDGGGYAVSPSSKDKDRMTFIGYSPSEIDQAERSAIKDKRRLSEL